MPFTGHRLSLVVPRLMVTPLQKESVFDCFNFNRSACGLSLQLTEISSRHKCTSSSNCVSDGMVNSLTLKKQTNARQQAAYIIELLYVLGFCDIKCIIFSIIPIVVGR